MKLVNTEKYPIAWPSEPGWPNFEVRNRFFRAGGLRLNVKTDTNLSLPILAKFSSLLLNPLKTQGPIIDLRKPSSAGKTPAY